MLKSFRLFLAACAVCAMLAASGCGPTNAWMKADGLFKSEKYEEAAAAYTETAKKYPGRTELVFNSGTARYMAKDYEEARRTFQKVARDAAGDLKEKAEYNTGNTCMAQQETDAAIEHYKRALYLKPDDMNAKWNLEMAQRKNRQQKKQKQQNQQDEKDKQDKDEEQKQQEQQQKQQNQQEQDKEKQEQQQQEQDKEKQQQKQAQQDRQKQKKQLSEEEARRLLRAMAEEDKKLQKRLRQPKYRSRTAPAGKDW